MSAEFLKTVRIFRNLDPQALQELGECFSLRKYRRNNLIIFEEDAGMLFFVIRSGQVKISRISQQGEEVILAILGAGQFFGEVSIIDGGTRSATVTSLDDVELMSIGRDRFQYFLNKYPKLAMALLREMAARFRKSDAQIKSLSLMDARQRVANTLFQLALELGLERREREYVIGDLPLQRDLASIAGTSRETVSRIITRFQEEGVVQRDGNSLIIPDLFRLERIFNEV
ncbi:Crp/Fnr family transcriptional regulator [bacterium]|nr:Crp/Fnr family transcriptional regulator [bacterium]